MATRKPPTPDASARVTLTPKQRIAVERLAGGATVTDTAHEVGVTRQTVSEWRALPVFRAALDAALADITGFARDRAKAHVEHAVGLWVRVMNDPDAEDRDRIRAAEALADRGGLTVTKGVDLTAKDLVVVAVDDVALLRGLALPGDA